MLIKNQVFPNQKRKVSLRKNMNRHSWWIGRALPMWYLFLPGWAFLIYEVELGISFKVEFFWLISKHTTVNYRIIPYSWVSLLPIIYPSNHWITGNQKLVTGFVTTIRLLRASKINKRQERLLENELILQGIAPIVEWLLSGRESENAGLAQVSEKLVTDWWQNN